MRSVTSVLIATFLVASAAPASTINVSAMGSVIFNGIGDPPLSGVGGGETAVVSFTVDSNNFVEMLPGDVRAYEIDPASFQLSFSGGVSVGLLNPLPGPAYFAIVEGFPVSDGFFVSSFATSPGGVPLEQEPFNFNLDLGYDGSTLTSLDIIDAKGHYAFDGLTRFGMNLWAIFPDNVALEMDFQELWIENEPVSVDGSSWSNVKALFR